METLPLELLTLVCQNLKTQHPPSLISFAVTSKRCYAAATKELFRNIQITVQYSVSLEYDVADCLRALKSSGSLKHVRQLSIRGNMQAGANASPLHKISRHSEGTSNWITLPGYDYEDPLAEDWIRQTSHKVVQFDDSLWSPLATLIEQLPCLTIVDYGCDDQIPSCVLRALKRHSNARIRLRLNSGSDIELNCQARAILTSPLLSCITMHRRRQTLIEEVITGSLLATISPTLKEARIICDSESLRQSEQDQLLPMLPWLGQGHSRPHGALQVLRFLGRRLSDSHNLLQIWHRRTDLSVLQVLDLRCHIGANALQWATYAAPFSALTDLYIQTEIFPSYSPSCCRAAESFLLSLPPLQGLSLRGTPGMKNLSAVLSHHGSTLRRLHFRPATYAVPTRSHARGELEIINDLCPILERLTFHIHRTKGDAREVGIYKSFGALQNLISLDLTLDATVHSGILIQLPTRKTSSSHVEDHSFLRQPFGLARSCSLLNSHVCKSLINSAIDATFAKSIFRVMASAKLPDSPRLEVLNVRVVGGGKFGPKSPLELHAIIGEISRSWMVMPSPRDDEVGVLVASELTPRSGPKDSQQAQPLLDPIERVFRWVWPSKGKGNWREEWESFPLAED